MASSYPMLRYGSSGQEVRRLQQALNRAGYSLEVDGGFGEKTRAALMDYQRRAGPAQLGGAGGPAARGLHLPLRGPDGGSAAADGEPGGLFL